MGGRSHGVRSGVLRVLADRVEIGSRSPPKFGTGETLLLLAGLALIVVGWLGTRTAAVYRAAALVLLNTVLLLVLLELGSRRGAHLADYATWK